MGRIGDEGDFIPLSALQHYLFCERQCALIHVERLWAENLFTAEGRLLHEKTATPAHETRRGVRVAMAMPLRSEELGVIGIADLVELHRDGKSWRPFPVEYKRGKPKAHHADEAQLCAQAICLEEMFRARIPAGALFYGKNRRREKVLFDDALRDLTREVAEEAHMLLSSCETPPPEYESRKCGACSLAEICRPKRLSRKGSVSAWLARRIAED